MSARIIPFRRPLRPLAKAYPDPPAGASLVANGPEHYRFAVHGDGRSVDIRMTREDLERLYFLTGEMLRRSP
jgi:hypothetical protein